MWSKQVTEQNELDKQFLTIINSISDINIKYRWILVNHSRGK